MPLNRDFLGRTAASSEPFEVTRGDIRRFATAIGDRNPAYHDVAAAQALGHPDLVAPPTFLISMGFSTAESLVMDPELGLDYSLVVHGEQRFELHRPVRVGDVLQLVSRVEDVKDAGRNELITTVTVVTAAAGEPVATLRGTIVSRGTAARPATPDMEA